LGPHFDVVNSHRPGDESGFVQSVDPERTGLIRIGLIRVGAYDLQIDTQAEREERIVSAPSRVFASRRRANPE
jgi:hypothetical protein